MKTVAISVSINPCSSRDNSGGTVTVRIPLIDPVNGEPRDRGDLYEAAVERACKRLYGAGAFWWSDSGLPGYGQVMRPCKSGGSDAVTYRAHLDVEISALPSQHCDALAERAARWEADIRQEQIDRAAGYDAFEEGKPLPAGKSWEFDQGWKQAAENLRWNRINRSE